MADADGWTPLHLAARYGHVRIVEFLAPLVDNPNAPKPDGWTPLHLAARYGHVKIVEFLAPLVDNPNAPMPNGWTPLHLAARNGHVKIVKFVLNCRKFILGVTKYLKKVSWRKVTWLRLFQKNCHTKKSAVELPTIL